MQFARFMVGAVPHLASRNPATSHWHHLPEADLGPDPLLAALGAGTASLNSLHTQLLAGPAQRQLPEPCLPPIASPGKILCIGLNYALHTQETDWQQPEHPNVFVRYAHTLVGHGAAILRPRLSTALDYEGEVAVVIGRAAYDVDRDAALEHVGGYCLFNDASVRDIQRRTSQWTLGKNFPATGACGPWLTTADALPPGARGLSLTTRLNDQVMQTGNTNDLIFDVATLIAELSAVMPLAPGDLIVTGTPAGVGFTRQPPVFMRPGDRVCIAVPELGELSNPIADA